MPRIVKIEAANDGKKKWVAIFDDGKRTKFGSFGSPDYTLSGDKKARDNYRVRHKKDLDTADPQRAGYLSYYILWGDSTSIEQNRRAFNKMFA